MRISSLVLYDACMGIIILWYYKRIVSYFKPRLDFVSEVSKDIAQVFLGVLTVESFTKSIIDWKLVLIGMILASVWWFIGIISLRIK